MCVDFYSHRALRLPEKVRQIRDVPLVEISSDDTARTITGQLRPIVSKFAYKVTLNE
jgi:hypothetical protein